MILDAILILDPVLEDLFEQRVREMELTVPNRWLEKGLKKGHEEGQAQALQIFLKTRFGTIPASLSKRLQNFSTIHLEALLPKAAIAASLDDFISQLPDEG